MKKILKLLFIILIQCILIFNINAVENGKVYNIQKSGASSAFGFENYDKHTASDGVKTVNAYCIDRSRSAPSTAKVTRVLGTDKEKIKYDSVIITILKEGENGVDYESTFLALRIFVNTIDLSGDGNGGVDPTYQKELEAILNCFLTDSSFKDIYTSYTGKSPKVSACKSPVKGEGNNKLGTVKEVLKKGLEAGVNDAKVDGKNTVEKGPATDPLREDGKISKIVTVKVNLGGIKNKTDFFKYLGFEKDNDNVDVELLGYSKTFIDSKEGWSQITESDEGFDLSKIDGEEPYSGELYIGFLVSMDSQDDGSGEVDDEEPDCEDVKITVKFKYNGKDIAALLANGSGLQTFYAYIPETGDPIDLNFELNTSLCDEFSCDPTSTLPNICEDGLEPDKETGNVEYEFREAYNAESGKYNIKKCLLSKNSEDAAGNKYKLIDNEHANMVSDNPYCEVKCKEDYIFGVPYKKNTESGRYFQISVSLKGQQDCYTSKIDYEKYSEDIVKKQIEIVKQYNSWLYEYENMIRKYGTPPKLENPYGAEDKGKYWKKGTNDSDKIDCGEDEEPIYKYYVSHSSNYLKYTTSSSNGETTITFSTTTVDDAEFADNLTRKDVSVYGTIKDDKCVVANKDWDNHYKDFEKNVKSAKTSLETLIKELKTIIDQYNACSADDNYKPVSGLNSATWDMIYRYDPEIVYSYDEPEPGVSTTKWINSVSSRGCEHQKTCDVMYSPDAKITSEKCNGNNNDNVKCIPSPTILDIDMEEHPATWICNGEADIELEQCDGSTTRSYSDKSYLVCTFGDTDTANITCSTSNFKVSDAKYVHKIASVKGTYNTERVYYSGHDDGNIKIQETPEREITNYDIIDGLPVGINTPTGTYYYKLTLKNIGTFYSNPKNLGRIYGTLDNSLSSKIRGEEQTKDGQTVSSNEYACTYDVNQNTCTDPLGNKHYKTECKENEDWDKCQERLCPVSNGPYCVEKAQAYYKCSNTYYDGSCEKVGNGTREETLLAVGCQPGEECENNFNCCPNCTVQCIGVCTVTPGGSQGGETKPNYDFRPISPGNLFPNDRPKGYNWESDPSVYKNSLVARKAKDTIDEITARANDITSEGSTTEGTTSTSGNPKVENYSLKVVMNSDMITKIREYNKTQESYNNDTMTCYDYQIDRDEKGCKNAGYTWKKEGDSGKCVMANIFCYSSFVDDLADGKFGGEVDIKNGDGRKKNKENLNPYRPNVNIENFNTDNLIVTNDYWTIYTFSTLDINGDGIPDVGPSWK